MISTLQFILGLLLLAIPAGLLWLFDRQLFSTLLIAFARMAVQLAVLGLVFWALLRLNSDWLNLLWFLLVSVGLGFMVVRRIGLSLGRHLLPVSAGLFLGNFIVGIYLLAFVLPTPSLLSVSWFVPLMALLSGHSAFSLIRGISAFRQARQNDALQYEMAVGNGASPLKALFPFFRTALQQMLAPSVSNISVLGLFTVPLLLLGMILGGIPLLDAFLLFVLLIVGCVVASLLSLLLSLWLSLQMNRQPSL